jgi:predicted nucleic acid-binding protein
MDTNVISELRKAKSGKADNNVVSWANTVSATRLFLSVMTILELETGVLLVERRDPAQGAVLRSWLNAHVLPAFSERILNVDIAVAQCCAKLPLPDPDEQFYQDLLAAGKIKPPDYGVITDGLCATPEDQDKFDEQQKGKAPLTDD